MYIIIITNVTESLKRRSFYIPVQNPIQVQIEILQKRIMQYCIIYPYEKK